MVCEQLSLPDIKIGKYPHKIKEKINNVIVHNKFVHDNIALLMRIAPQNQIR